MFVKSDDKDKSIVVGSLVEIGEIPMNTSCEYNETRLVITNDGYVIFIDKDKLDIPNQSTLPQTLNMDKYIKNNPNYVLVKSCSSLVDNIKKFAFSREDDSIEDALYHTPETIAILADGYKYNYLFLGQYFVQGRQLGGAITSAINSCLRPEIKNSISKMTFEEIKNHNPKTPYCILLGDILLNICRAICQTRLYKAHIRDTSDSKSTKWTTCTKIINSSLWNEKEIQKFLKNKNPKETFFNFMPWFKDKYYFDPELEMAVNYFNEV